jgi:hypothetical protein
VVRLREAFVMHLERCWTPRGAAPALKGSFFGQNSDSGPPTEGRPSINRLDQQELSNRSGVSVPRIKRMEAGDGPICGNYENVAAVVGVLEAAGIEFIPENGGGPGARLRTTATTPPRDRLARQSHRPRRRQPGRSAGGAFPGSKPTKRLAFRRPTSGTRSPRSRG